MKVMMESERKTYKGGKNIGWGVTRKGEKVMMEVKPEGR